MLLGGVTTTGRILGKLGRIDEPGNSWCARFRQFRIDPKGKRQL